MGIRTSLQSPLVSISGYPYLIILGTLFACSAIVAQDFGAGRLERVHGFLPQGLWVAVVLSAMMTPLCLNSGAIIELLELPNDTTAKTAAYVSRVGLGFPLWESSWPPLPHTGPRRDRPICDRQCRGISRQRASELHAHFWSMGRTGARRGRVRACDGRLHVAQHADHIVLRNECGLLRQYLPERVLQALIGSGLAKYSPWDCRWASLFSGNWGLLPLSRY